MQHNHRHLHLPIIVLSLIGLLLTFTPLPTEDTQHGVGVSLGLILLLIVIDLFLLKRAHTPQSTEITLAGAQKLLQQQPNTHIICISIEGSALASTLPNHAVIHIPLEEIPIRLHRIESYRGGPLVVIGVDPQQQQQAITLLQGLGFMRLYSLRH